MNSINKNLNRIAGVSPSLAKNRLYKNETIADCVERYVGGKESISSISKDTMIPQSTIHRWVNEIYFAKFNHSREVGILNLKSDV